MRLHFLDVGQADCTIVEFPSGHVLVVDGGDGSYLSNRHLVRYIKGLDFASLTLVATHSDVDHCGGLAYLLRTFGAEKVYLPNLSAETGPYVDLVDEVAAAAVDNEVLSRYGVIVDESGAYALCLSPYSFGESDINDASAVLFISYADVNILLGGDISSAREQTLVNDHMVMENIFDAGDYTAPLNETNILKVSHHGSAGSSSQDWLDLLSAETAILSCGAGNAYGHPAAETVARLKESGAQVYRTDELGDIMITISPDGTYRTEWNYIS